MTVLVSVLAMAPTLDGRAYGQASPAADHAETGHAETGRELAATYCAGCHAIGAAGASTHPASPPFRTLSQNYPIASLEEAFAEGVLSGHPDMPEFVFEPQQIDDLIAYIESVQRRQGDAE